MSDQQPAPQAYPQPRAISAGYRRWATVLAWFSAVLGVLVVVAFVASFVLLAQADADTGDSALGYLAIFLWFGIVAAVPVLLAVGIPALVMKRRVRQQRAQPQPLASGDSGPGL